MKKDKLLLRTICHEWGHCLQYLFGGYIKFVYGLEVESSLERVDGHTFVNSLILCDYSMENPTNATMQVMCLDDVENISIFVAGAVAEKICGYTKGVVKGTDKAKIKSITNDKNFIDKIYNDVVEKMAPFKAILEYLTEKTLENHIVKDADREIRVEVSKEDMISLLKEAFINNGGDVELLEKEGPNIAKTDMPIKISNDILMQHENIRTIR